MSKLENIETFSCLVCGGTGSMADPYKEATQGVHYGDCKWCDGTGKVDEFMFNYQFEAFSE